MVGGTERSDLLAVGFYKTRRGVACLVLSIAECSICRGVHCLFNWVYCRFEWRVPGSLFTFALCQGGRERFI